MAPVIYRNRRQRRGTVLVEDAIALPILVFITFAMIEYGWIFVKVQQINNAARHAARIGALYNINTTNVEVEGEVASLMSAAGITDYSVAFDPGDVSSLEPGQTLTITVSVPYQGADIELLGIPLIPVPAGLESSVSMAKEGS